MRLPSNLTPRELVKLLETIDYVRIRQRSTHIRMRTERPSRHHVTIVDAKPIKVGTLRATLRLIANHRGQTVDQVAEELFG